MRMKASETDITISYQYQWKGISVNKWEHEILLLLMEGYSYNEICERFLMTFDTFFSHIRTIHLKLKKKRGLAMANEFLYRVALQAVEENIPLELNIHHKRNSLFNGFYNE